MNKSKFFDECAKHDWFYEMSDDHGVYSAGKKAYDALTKEAKNNPEVQEIWAAWFSWFMSYGASDLPKREDYI